MSPFTPVTLAEWRAQVEKELAGKPFEKALVQQTVEGLAIFPLYTEGPTPDPAARAVAPAPFRVAMRAGDGWGTNEVRFELDAGADAIWLGNASIELSAEDRARAFWILKVNGDPIEAVMRWTALGAGGAGFTLDYDPIGAQAAGRAKANDLGPALQELGALVRTLDTHGGATSALMISSLPQHGAGADAADELAWMLSTGVRYLEALDASGVAPAQAAAKIAFQVAVGRDTFLELCKLRALRVGWAKILAAMGVTNTPPTRIHAVCSERTMTARDPWVNMLRGTTQVFAAVLGGADWVTPLPFDEALGADSAIGRRVARNTGLVLREESFLGKVKDPAGGAYFFETLTDSLAREAWLRFQFLEREGGAIAALRAQSLSDRFAKTRKVRDDQIAKRKMALLGVSEFANLTEHLPSPAPAVSRTAVHRDAANFERLRSRAEAIQPAPEAVLLTLGSFAESRARAGFAAGFFASGGIRSRETSQDETARIVCLCGTDERYQTEAIAHAKTLKASGCQRVLIAGRPDPKQEAAFKEAGVDGYIFAGCDAIAALASALELFS
jgi:methylmalonyl-CoA mutase